MKTRRDRNKKLMTAGVMAPLIGTLGLGADPGGAGTGDRGMNRFSVSGRFMFNVSADFAHQASTANPGPGVGMSAADRVYDNGFVKVDDSSNAGGVTWNWGFTDQSSVMGNTLQLQSVRSPADGLTQCEIDDPQYGFELGYGRVLKSFELGRGHTLNLGLQGAFGLTFLDIRNNSSITGATTGVQDSYDLSGLPMIPNAPYFGGRPVPGGPLPLLIPDSPFSRDEVNVPVTASERMTVEGTLYGFKLGPFLEVPLGNKAAVRLQGGFGAVLADGDFRYNESLSTGRSSAAAASKSDWLYGGFVEGQLSVSLGKGWTALAGAGWQPVGDYSLSAGTKNVRVKFDNAVVAFGGLSWAF